jgi:DUF4097 and DUF4098 domain-containing protein YvlB
MMRMLTSVTLVSCFATLIGCAGDAPTTGAAIPVGGETTTPGGTGTGTGSGSGSGDTTPAGVNKPVSIDNANGDLKIIGTTEGKISGTITPFASSNDGNDAAHAADIQAAIDDVKGTVVVDLTSSPARIACGQARADHGAVSRFSTGCLIELNLPKVDAKLVAITNNGDVSLDDAGGTFELGSSNGAITGTRLAGAIAVDTSNGEVKLQIAPAKGAAITANSSNGSVELTLPATFAADMIELATSNGDLLSSFPGVTNHQGYGTPGSGASLIRLETSNGDISLARQ